MVCPVYRAYLGHLHLDRPGHHDGRQDHHDLRGRVHLRQAALRVLAVWLVAWPLQAVLQPAG